MDLHAIAEDVLAAVGGKDNILANDICMTRLRILMEDPELADTERLVSISGVLGFVKRGANGIEVVFGPGKVEGVHEALVSLTGIEPDDEAFEEASGSTAPIRVHINPNPLRAAALSRATVPHLADDEGDLADDLADLLDDMIGAPEDEQEVLFADEEPGETDLDESDWEDSLKSSSARVLVINGPNINMIGIREPDIYGKQDYQALLLVCHEAATEAGFAQCTCFQSNHEGDLIDAIQDAYDSYDAIVINPGAYTHTSIALLDAAKAVSLPIVEVHISKVEEREDFRQISYIRAACIETITGLGLEGYRKAIFDLAEHLGL